jgi:hypothetical protein
MNQGIKEQQRARHGVEETFSLQALFISLLVNNSATLSLRHQSMQPPFGIITFMIILGIARDSSHHVQTNVSVQRVII